MCENDFHVPRGTSNFGMADVYCDLADWLNDALAGKKPADLDRVAIVGQKEGPGPYAEPAKGVYPPDRLGGRFSGLTAAQRGPSQKE